MKRNILILLAVVAIVGGGWYYYKNSTFGWETYTNEEYGFEVKFPSSWSGYHVSDGYYGDGGKEVSFFLPTWTAGPENPEEVGLSFIISIYTIDQYIQLANSDRNPTGIYLTRDTENVFFYNIQLPPDNTPEYRAGEVVDSPNIEKATAQVYEIPKTFKLIK